MAMQELIVAARRKLLADPNFAALVGVDVGKDAAGQAYADAWVFKATDDTLDPVRNPRGTGLSSIVIAQRRPWIEPNHHNTLSFPLLEFRIVSDSMRDPNDNTLVAQYDGDYRCSRIGKVIRDIFHDAANMDHSWPNNVEVVSCVLWNDLELTYIDEEEGLAAGEISFALQYA